MIILDSEHVVFKKEGEACGVHFGGNDGYCSPGLTCEQFGVASFRYSPGWNKPSKQIGVSAWPGKCVLEGKLYPR